MVLSNSTRDKLVDTNPSPHHYLPTGDAAGVIVIPAASSSVEPIPGADDDHKPGRPLQNEFVLFHEYGHLSAHRLKIWSGNNWVNELVPNIFMNTYLVQSRTDLDFVLQERRKNPRPALRYTSLAYLDYLYGAEGGGELLLVPVPIRTHRRFPGAGPDHARNRDQATGRVPRGTAKAGNVG